MFLYAFLYRHRAVNLFIQGYNKSWISAEEHSFEEKLVEDLAMFEKVSCSNIRCLKSSSRGQTANHYRPSIASVWYHLKVCHIFCKLQNKGMMELCAVNKEEENDLEDGIKPIDPLLQLITLFSRSALTERRCVFIVKDHMRKKS